MVLAFRTTLTTQMVVRLLKETAMFFTYDFYFGIVVFVLHLRIVIDTPMY